MKTPKTVRAIDFANPKVPAVNSAESLAHTVGGLIRSGEWVVVSFDGYRAISSSYFNALLVKLTEYANPDVIQERVQFLTESDAQRTILGRSIAAVLGKAA